ncbi:defective in cullin neddylation protein AAR3 isoform X2 [Typha angustifolia]|uniref:defective in cullin neddylation protein AAR3 isoform X2 n=1 Tax=Typha angustifolia TaxID=59011 RepID=UPI003C2AAEDD
MGFSGPHRSDIFEIYAMYCDIVLASSHASSKEMLIVLSKSLNNRVQMRDTILSDLSKLMSSLVLSVDSHQFDFFYDFVFFICRENGQKNITVQRAVTAWRIVLNGSFRLLNQWCNFVEEHQRHNISEDTWQQLLAFSRCVNEDLEGYDPKGAWPVLIDDFVEHIISQSSNCRMGESLCSCSEMETEPSISNTFSGLNLLPGSKRRFPDDIDREELKPSEDSISSIELLKLKRMKRSNVGAKFGWHESGLPLSACGSSADYHADMHKHNSLCRLRTSACVVEEDCLSEGFEGYLSIGCCFQFDQKSSASCI